MLIVPVENDIIRAVARCRKNKEGRRKSTSTKEEQFWKELTKIIKKEANKGCSYVCLHADKYLAIPAEEMWDTLTKQGYWFDNIYIL